MALSLSQTNALVRLLKPRMKIASFGYPDIIAPVTSMDFKIDWNELKIREDSEVICKRHGIQKKGIPDAHSFFGLLGCTLDVFDVTNERGCEIYRDLNLLGQEPFKSPSYDIVLDVGTAEHCFQIGQALINMAEMVKAGGWIIHENPANWGNHGFYNLNPTLFADFYDQNGFRVDELKLVSRDGRYVIPHPVHRFRYPNEEVNIFCIAQRIQEQILVYPIQTKYKSLIPAAGGSGERAASERAKEIANG